MTPDEEVRVNLPRLAALILVLSSAGGVAALVAWALRAVGLT